MATAVLASGVIIALLSPTDVFHTTASQAVMRGEAGGDAIVVSASAWAEVLAGSVRKGPEAVTDTERLLHTLDDVIDVDQEIAAHAARLRTDDLSIRLPDAFVAATAQVLEDGVLLTTDTALAEKIAPGLAELVTV
ncbi:PIN domain-containing protein [Thermobifida halotolerans]|uniref:PIN domain-containing protein n=1 Tax=Thermobifida halotolerans TaxID=483545 RepID=A0A399FXS5_9ACTN|nr:PIN domain-containing protein [Thermobifida halotolerans]UOE18800.1 PIN domain-containing protein [Thermobifida halotolerans]